jgi:serine/threonine-protein kinase
MTDASPRTIGPYVIHQPFGGGGMASVHFGRIVGSGGFSRVVAVKRLHAELARDEQVRAMLVDEGRLTARIRHPNVVTTLDVVEADGEVLLVLDYVHGESLAVLARRAQACGVHGGRVPPPLALAIAVDVLRGLHAAHQCTDPRGEPLELVHRDVSPHNILVDIHGIAKIADFGVAKARGRMQALTKKGELKGKASYVAPEQVHGNASRRSDVFAMGIVLWEALSGERLFVGASQGATLGRVLLANVPDLRAKVPEVTSEVARAIGQGLERRPEDRFATALDFARALEASGPIATRADVARWVEELAGPEIEARARLVAELEGEALRPESPHAQHHQPRRPTARRLLVAFGGLTVLGGAFAWLRAGSAATPEPAVFPQPSAERSGPLGLSPEPPNNAQDEGAAPAQADSAPAQVDSAPITTSLRPSTEPPRRAVRRAPKADCTPPYVIAGGRKLFKPECF